MFLFAAIVLLFLPCFITAILLLCNVLLACFQHYIIKCTKNFFSFVCPAEMGVCLICLCVLYPVKYCISFSLYCEFATETLLKLLGLLIVYMVIVNRKRDSKTELSYTQNIVNRCII